LSVLYDAIERPASFDVLLVDTGLEGMDARAFARAVTHEPRFADIRLCALCSHARRPDSGTGSLAAAGFAGALWKPIRRAELVTCLRRLENGLKALQNDDVVATKPFLPALPRIDVKILLAEDNPTNQKVAAGMLSKLGLDAEIVWDGHAAIAKLMAKDYDIVFMDLQMPGMDGISAVRAIRAAAGARNQDVPIIAMTAHALERDRKRCLDAGMNDYIAKPVTIASFAAMISKWTSDPVAPTVDIGAPKASPEPPVEKDVPLTFNKQAFLTRIGDDNEIAKEVALSFLENAPNLVRDLGKAIEDGDSSQATLSAHSLVGAAGVVGGETVVESAMRLQQEARDQDLASLRAGYSQLTRRFDELKDAIEKWDLLAP